MNRQQRNSPGGPVRYSEAEKEMTRLLIQKPVAYADMEENARIAVSVLAQDGWHIQRVGLDINVTVNAQLVGEPPAMAELRAAVDSSLAKYILLRQELAGQRWRRWRFGFWAAACTAVMLRVWPGWGGVVVQGCCALAAATFRFMDQKKGAA